MQVPALGPGCFAACSSDWGAEIRAGLLEAATPRGPDRYSSVRSEERLGHGHVGDDLAVCMAVMYPGQHPSLPPSPGPPCPTTLQQALEVELGLLVQLLHARRAPGRQEDVHRLLP